MQKIFKCFVVAWDGVINLFFIKLQAATLSFPGRNDTIRDNHLLASEFISWIPCENRHQSNVIIIPTHCDAVIKTGGLFPVNTPDCLWFISHWDMSFHLKTDFRTSLCCSYHINTGVTGQKTHPAL